MAKNPKERTVVLIKPDGVKRGIVGEILTRFEKAGLKILAMKMVWVKENTARKHYPGSRKEWVRGLGEKTLETYKKYGFDPREELGKTDAFEIGKMVLEWNIEFLTSGPVIAILLEGVHAIDNVRMIAGKTLPIFADPGTIRGDFSVDSPDFANKQKRAIHNIVHASGNPKEARLEEQLWFKKNEIYKYKRADEDIMFA